MLIKEKAYQDWQEEVGEPVDQRGQERAIVIQTHQIEAGGHGAFHQSDRGRSERKERHKNSHRKSNQQGPVVNRVTDCQEGAFQAEEHQHPVEQSIHSRLQEDGGIPHDDVQAFVKIVEKPNVEDAPSTLINISKYVLSKDIIDMAVKFVETEKDGEYYITDVINEFVNNGGRVKVLEAVGEYLDGGNPSAWLHANRVVMGDIA